jgi:hypothetical protein
MRNMRMYATKRMILAGNVPFDNDFFILPTFAVDAANLPWLIRPNLGGIIDKSSDSVETLLTCNKDRVNVLEATVNS